MKPFNALTSSQRTVEESYREWFDLKLLRKWCFAPSRENGKKTMGMISKTAASLGMCHFRAGIQMRTITLCHTEQLTGAKGQNSLDWG